MTENWNELTQAEDMVSTSATILDAMRADFETDPPELYADFETYPPELRAKLLDMLCQSGTESPEWWRNVLVGDGVPAYEDMAV